MLHTYTAHILAAALLTALCGCGQMGPLYMPAEDKTETTDDDATAAQPAQSQQDADKS